MPMFKCEARKQGSCTAIDIEFIKNMRTTGQVAKSIVGDMMSTYKF